MNHKLKYSKKKKFMHHKVRYSKWSNSVLTHHEQRFHNLERAIEYAKKLLGCNVKIYNEVEELVFSINNCTDSVSEETYA